MTALRKKYRQASQEMEAKKAGVEQARDRRKELQKQKEKLHGKLAQFDGEKRRLEEAEKRLQQIRGRIAELEKKITALGEVKFDPAEYEEVSQRFQELQKIHEHALKLQALVEREPEVERRRKETETRLQALEKQLAQLKKQQDALEFDAGAYEQAKKVYDERLNRLTEVRETLREASKALAEARTRLQQKKKEFEETQKKLQQAEALKEEILYYQALVEHFGRFRLHLSGRLRPLIAARASELLRLTTSGRYSLLELDEDYNIRIVDQGQTFALHRFSGGEQDLANLCLRVAISQVVAERSGKAPVQFIVLDEIFGSQDEQRRRLILEALAHLQAHFRQIFLISHVNEIKEGLPVIVEVQMTDGLHSRTRMI